ncbi:MAG: hypothetical protein ACLRXC_12180 [[Clostridium] leptum]
MREEVERRAIAISLTAGSSRRTLAQLSQHFGRSGKNGGRP